MVSFSVRTAPNLFTPCVTPILLAYGTKNMRINAAPPSFEPVLLLHSGCPIVWHSKLHTDIALSTCEAEYIALSQCARALIPLRRLIDNISNVFKPKKINTPPCRDPYHCNSSRKVRYPREQCLMYCTSARRR